MCFYKLYLFFRILKSLFDFFSFTVFFNLLCLIKLFNLKDLSPLSSFYKNFSYIYANNQKINMEKSINPQNNIFNLSLDLVTAV